MSEDHKKQLEQQLWNIANTLRGKMNADEFRDYILGFIFYKYLAEKMEIYANTILQPDGIQFTDIDENTQEGQEYIEAIREEALEKLGYFLKPSELFSAIAKRGNHNADETSLEQAADTTETYNTKHNFILEDLQKILNNVQNSTMGTESEEDFDNLFEDMDLNSTKLGKTPEARNEVIAKVLAHLDKIDFQLDQTELDVLGDAYEYLIGKFASGAGKKAGEFYTPQEVSMVLAKLVTTGKHKLKSVYDPTCGSGSLLLRVAKEVEEVNNFYGQELNRTTYNLARMNMILHGVHYRKFDIKQEDTLEHPQHLEHRFEAIVANPPFSANWSANPLFMSDDRFSQYGKLAPKGYADLAFLQHMIYQLEENGTMAIVLPHGALFRTGKESYIREYLIKEKNYIDAVIGLPKNLFYGTETPTCIIVLKKCRENPENILYIDASRNHGHHKTKNILREKDIMKIVSAFRERVCVDQFSNVILIDEIIKNECNLGIHQYIKIEEEKSILDESLIIEELKSNELELDNINLEIKSQCETLGVSYPDGNNISLLRQYREAIQYKLFEQKVRFLNNQGQSYRDWETKTLDDLFDRKTDKNIDDDIDFVLTNSATKGIVSQDDYFDKKIANKNNLKGYYIVDINDFVYNPRISQSAPVGPLKRNKIAKGIMSPLYTVLTCKDGDLDFYEKYFDTDFWHGYMRSVANYGARHDRMNIKKNDLLAMPLPFPDVEEQSKIAAFLNMINKKIELITQTVVV